MENSINGILLHRVIRDSLGNPTDSVILEVNKNFQNLTGLSSEETTGQKVEDVFQDPIILEKLKKLEKTKKPVRFEEYLPQFDKYLEIFSFPTVEDEYATVFLDISSRKYSEGKKEEIKKELTSRLKQQSALSEISQLTLSQLSLKQIFQKTVKILLDSLEVDYTKILRYIPEDHELEMEAGVGWNDPGNKPYRVPADINSQAGYTLMSEKPVVVQDLSLETRFSGPQLLVDHQVTSGVSVIIGQIEDPYGVLGVHTTSHRIFSSYDVEFLQSVANVLAGIINEKHVTQKLEESEIRYRLLAENASDMISTHDLETNYTYASPYCLELMGYLPEELEGKNACLFIHPDDIKTVIKSHENLLSSQKTTKTTYRLKHKQGPYVWVESTARILNPQTGEIIVITRDISERIRAEEELKSSLKDKEILLQEIHHRVKNNMQIISSLLNLQSAFINDSEAVNILRESQNRVKSMALLHEHLYQSREMDRVNFKHYVKNLTDNLLSTYSSVSSNLKREILVEDVRLNIETAIPCGLIINELLTNSLKYAFPQKEKGTIFLKIYSHQDNYVLLLGDDGVGLPPDLDPESTQTLGLRLVHNLVNQIDGKLNIKPSKGTCFEIIFKEVQYKKRI
ncbi:MAG: PAS domain S-box protein [Methanobacteriaceae archaeon]|nr:PAS domain S-box protein [Methanobacteriaceae archaeon]